MVKFRKLDEAVHERLQTGAPESDETHPAAMPIQGEGSDDEDLGAEQEAQARGIHENEHRRGDQKLAFAIDPQIDIHSRALLDMISDELEGDQPLPARVKTVAESDDISIDEAFDNW